MGEGKLDRKAVLKTSLPEKGASYIRELGGSLFLGKLRQRGSLKNFPSWKGGFLYQRVGGELIFILKGCLMYQSIPNPPMSPRHIPSAFDWSFALYRGGFNPNRPIRHLTFVSKHWSASQAKGLCNSLEMHSFCIWEPLKKSVKCIHVNSPRLSRSLLNTALISGSPVQVIKSPTKNWLLYFFLL